MHRPKASLLQTFFVQALESANDAALLCALMDIGGDKPVDYLNIPAEANPFLRLSRCAYL
ncbi:multiphosphoryl transfer protein 2 [includes phosphoenolpyruvate-protein phosphotransferase);phosphocarrier protein Hpr; fructose-like specific PTS system EIIA component] [Escherichia coli]|uniref:Multiphosphoryl transfer protein 2 [includes phosphoenolpyruvate-protein phosphotransferasephosphocarrier protein Hpr fructose-like specific PTS system EIIA component] n=1 Tax=Escherichia coli TaxID=562 RepID=A0A2X3M9C5_ECOLX|nr:multiphosphoryl transfer protein 2 [includes phosphoenolpyruvate-protein phosphotransferase);phosphocarrier protein Hpr; fructose-like specific PTS system EIIA component] [Escherichia coli]